MLAKLRARATFSNVVSALALFIALGGTAYAAVTVTGKNVKNGSLTGADVKNNSLTGSDVKGLGPADFTAGVLPAGAQGPAGAKGDTGAAGANGTNGADGADGAPGISGLEVVEQSVGDTSNLARDELITASCPVGKNVLGGGWTSQLLAGTWTTEPNALEVDGPVTGSSPEGYRARIKWQASDDSIITVRAICANVAP